MSQEPVEHYPATQAFARLAIEAISPKDDNYLDKIDDYTYLTFDQIERLLSVLEARDPEIAVRFEARERRRRLGDEPSETDPDIVWEREVNPHTNESNLRESAYGKLAGALLIDAPLVVEHTGLTLVTGENLPRGWRRKTTDLVSHAESQQLFEDVSWSADVTGTATDYPTRELAARLLIGREWYARVGWPYELPVE